MHNPNNPKLTRRAFLYSSGATLGAATVAFPADAAPFSSLFVETIYQASAGQEALVAVRLKLRNASGDLKVIDFAAADFVPLGSTRLPRLDLVGLNTPFRDPSKPVADETVLTITVSGVDLFNQTSDLDREPCTYVFRIAARITGRDKTKTVTWQIGMQTNVWVKTGRNQWLDFPIVGLGTPSSLALVDLISGNAGFKLELGRGWVTETLTRVVGQNIAARGDHVAVLSAVPLSDEVATNGGKAAAQPEGHRSWFWSVRPIDGVSLLTAYGGVLQFRSIRLGWVRAKATEPPSAPSSVFEITTGNEPPPPGAFTIDRTLVAPPNGKVDLPSSRFVIRGEKTSDLTIDASSLQASWNTRFKKAERSPLDTQMIEVTFDGHFAVALKSGGAMLAKVNYAESPGLRLTPVMGVWRLFADFPASRSKIAELEDLAIHTEGRDVGRDEIVPVAQIRSLSAGWLALRQASDGPLPGGMRLVAELPAGRVESLAIAASLAEVPATLARDSQLPFFSRVDVVAPGIEPILRLQKVPLAGFSDAEAGRLGHIYLDLPSGEAETIPVLDLPLDAAVIRVRRASDMLLLDFRLANMRLRSTKKEGAFVLLPDAVEKPDDLSPVGFPNEPVLLADFGSQHMAEQAFLRRDALAGGLPALDFQAVGAIVGAEWPQIVAAAFETLREGTRQEKAQAKTKLRELASRAAYVLYEGTNLSEEEKRIAADLGSYDPDIANRVKDFQAFGKAFDGAAGWLLGRQRPPEDQRVYCGPDDLDPDVANFAWRLRSDDHLVIRRTKLIERLISVDASYDAAGLNRNSLTETPALPAEILSIIEGATRPIVGTISFRPSLADAAVLAVLDGKATDDDAQRRASGEKERLAPDYADFRVRWKRAANAARPKFSQSDFALAENFVSVRWALLGRRENDPILQIMRTVMQGIVSLTGEEDEPFAERTRARLAGPTRLAFRWSRRHDPDARRAATAPFSLSELLDWGERDQLVTPRARGVRALDREGRLVRVDDPAEYLRLQGFEPGEDLSARSWMDKVYAHASKAPLPFETAIELPFRLQLSPAQDPTWVFPHDVSIERSLKDVDGSEPSLGRPLWSVALEPLAPDPLLRAVWSEDFWPERFRNERDRLGKASDPRDASVVEALNAYYGPPERGPVAPWYRKRLKRQNGEIIDVLPAGVLPEEREFRASMDPYDRDQIVLESSVPGILVKRGVDPASGQIIEGGSSYSPPEGYDFIDIAAEQLPGSKDQAPVKIASAALYAPKSLNFRELRLTALGGTLDLHTRFKPPVSADLLDGGKLFPAATLESWRHLAVLGRTIVEELEYAGYLFPFGHHASLVKVTERRYVQPPNVKRGPTSYLVQRLFIRCSDPVKKDWYDQPDAGRAWPVGQMEILTGESPDLVDPLPGPPSREKKFGEPIANELANGRISLVDGRGLVFWPRTAPFKGAEVPFEFQIDGSPYAHRLPMVFVDNEAANDEKTLASLVTYYNRIPSGASLARPMTGFLSSKLDRSSLRVFDQAGASRRYGVPLEEGQTDYETQAWSIGVEGRPGDARESGAEDALTKSRSAALSLRSNYGFSPLLLATDQPPFYPFVQFAEIRLDRLARLTGERQGRECLVAFERGYLKDGFLDPAQPASIPEAMLGILSEAVLDVGSRGDRIGAIGRFAGRLFLIARKEGPLTRDKRDSAGDFSIYLLQPPDFATRLKPAATAASAPPAPLLATEAQAAADDSKAKSLRQLLETVLGDGDVKIFGSFSLLDLINQAVMELAEAVPVVKEVTDYAGEAASSLIEMVRGTIAPALRSAVQAIDEEFKSAAVAIGGAALELRRVYPQIGDAMSGLDAALGDFERARDNSTAGAALTSVVTAGKSLLSALDKAGRDPISPLKLELRRVLLSELQDVELIEQRIRALINALPTLDAILEKAVQGGIAALGTQLVDQNTKADVVSAITRLMPLPDQIAGGDPKFKAIAEEVTGGVYTGIVDPLFKEPAPSNPHALVDKLTQIDIATVFANALAASTTLKALKADLAQTIAPLEAEARSYWSQVVFLWTAIDTLVKQRDELTKLIGTSAEIEVRHYAEALQRQVAIDLHRLGDKAARILFGIDAAAVLAEAGVLNRMLNGIKEEPDFGRKSRNVMTLLQRLDQLFLRGRFGRAAEDALTGALDDARLAAVIGPVLDGYSALLDLADVYVLQSDRLDPVVDFAGEVASAETAVSELLSNTGLGGVAATMRNLAARLSNTAGDIDSEVETIVRELQDRLDRAAASLKAAGIPHLSEVIERTGKLALAVTAGVGEGLKTFGRSEVAELRHRAAQFVEVYAAILEEVLRAHARTAVAVHQARLAMSAWRDLSSSPPRPVAAEARQAIEQARRMPSLASYRTVLATFPRSELCALFDAWPKVANQTLEAVQDLLPAFQVNLEALRGLPPGGDEVAKSVQQVETALASFVEKELIITKDRALAAGRSFAEAGRWVEGTVLSPTARLINTARDASARLQQSVATYPFLQPFSDLLVQVVQDFSKAPDVVELEKTLLAATGAGDRLSDATKLDDALSAARELRIALQLTGDANRLASLRIALGASLADAELRTRDLVIAQAAAAVAALKNQADAAADTAEAWLVGQVFASQAVSKSLATLAQSTATIRDTRNKLLAKLLDGRLGETIGTVMQFLKLGPANVAKVELIPASLFVAVASPSTAGKSPVEEKIALLENMPPNGVPDDLLEDETRLVQILAAFRQDSSPTDAATQLSALRVLLNQNSSDLAAIQIIGNFRTVMDQILQANFASLVDFQAVRRRLEEEVRKLLPTRVTTQLDYSVPLKPFPEGAPIFNPIGDGRFTVQSVNIVDFANPGEPKFEARAQAVLAPFEIKLLGSFDAITLVFSAAKLTWSQGGEPHFSIDFIDYRIGSALSFVDQLAGALGQSGGGAFVKLAFGFPGIEAGYRINIPSFTLGGVTFLNVGLSAGARLPFDSRPAEFLAALSSREDPFVIIAGIWGGGGHFQLSSDGRSITGFDASFVFGGGGGVTYGPLTMVGRITVGVFIRKVGQYTEIAGDFFAGGSGRVAIFGISASLTVTTGMTGDGDMFGSAVFRYSFSVGFAKVSFSVTVAKKESKGFAQQKQAMLESHGPYMVANAGAALQAAGAPGGRTARLKITTVRQDSNYRAWRRYFSTLRPEGY